MMDASLSVRAVSKSLPGFHLGPISFDLEPGLVYAVVGPNGSGKSTLFRLLMGMIRPDSGSILRFGQPLAVDDMAQARRLAWLSESLTGHDGWSMRDLAEIYVRSYPGFDHRTMAAHTADIDLGKDFAALSKGQQRRSMLGLTVAANADVMLLDEPTDGIDPFARQDVMAALADVMEDDRRTMLIATHNLEEVRRIAEVVIVLDRGNQVGIWPKDQLLEGWQRLTLSRLPQQPLAGEAHREGVNIVTGNASLTRAELAALDIEILQVQQVDMVESLHLVMMQQGDRASPLHDTSP